MFKESVKRKPVKRFTEWALSEKRKKRIERAKRLYVGPYKEAPATFSGFVQFIFNKAPKLLDLTKTPKTRMLFLGQGMRPLFETIRGLNEIRQVTPRKNIKYIVPPAREKITSTAFIPTVKRELERRKVVPKGKCTIYLIDFSTIGVTFRKVKRAIELINPEAKIEIISQHSEEYGSAMLAAEHIERPTEKKENGRVFRNTRKGATDQYLIFQKLLQEWLEKPQNK